MNKVRENVSRTVATGVAALAIGLIAGYVLGKAPWSVEEAKGWVRSPVGGCNEDCEYYVGEQKIDTKCYCQNEDSDADCYSVLCNDDSGLGSSKPTTQQP